MSTAAEMLQKYIAAEAAVLEGQEVRFGPRVLTLADLAEIRQGRQEWSRLAAAETAKAAGLNGRRPIQVRP